MANIDPDLQKKLNAAVLNFSATCKRLCTNANAAALTIQAFAILLDTPAAKSAKIAADQVISKAKR